MSLVKVWPSQKTLLIDSCISPPGQVAIGTIKLQPTPSFFPLVFHVCGILTDLSRHTGTFIPVLPFLLEVRKSAFLAGDVHTIKHTFLQRSKAGELKVRCRSRKVNDLD